MDAPLDSLLERSTWTRELARRLVRDADEADELVQQTWVAALEKPPSRSIPIKSWIAGVMRNLAREGRRGDARRTERERAAARGEVDCSREGLVEKLETHRALVAAVATLGEPSRSTILMRYFEGLSPREIARRTNTPVRTVHTRLHRALHELRRKLDTRYDERSAWLLALAPLARAKHATLAAWGAVILDAKLKVVCVAVAAIGVASFFALRSIRGVAPSTDVVRASAGSVAGTTASDEVARELSTAQRTEVAQPVANRSSETMPAVAEQGLLHGRVLDATGASLPGVLVHWSPFGGGTPIDATAPSARDGRFEMPLPGGGGTLECADERYAVVLGPTIFDASSDGEHVLVVAPRIRIAGQVTDSSGQALEGVVVSLWLPHNFRARFAEALTSSSDVRCDARSDAQGQFTLESVPAIEGANLIAELEGYTGPLLDLPQNDKFDLAIVMTPRGAGELLSGVVLDVDGNVVEGAHVVLGEANASTDAHGNFTLLLASAGDSSIVRAAHTGSLSGEVRRLGDANNGRGAWPDPLVIRLGGAPLSITGRVVDAEDQPISDAEVWTEDKTEFGRIQRRRDNARFLLDVSAEQLARGEEWFERKIRTDGNGRFELKGLLARSYSLRVVHATTLDFASTAPIAAGAKDVVIRIERVEHRARVAGHVVSRAGVPVAEASVEAVVRIDPPAGSPNGSRTLELRGITVVTDSEGWFEMHDVPMLARALYVSSAACVGKQFELAADADCEHLKLVVTMNCQVQIDLRDSRVEATSAKLLDAGGNELACQVYHGDLSMASKVVDLSTGRSEVFTVTEDARTLVLQAASGAYEPSADGKYFVATVREVARREIHLVPGSVNVLH
jgi:RNA polymerase sigma-70 factor (ECF subfamily)